MKKMIDLGQKIGGPEQVAKHPSTTKEHVYYPCLSITSKKAIGGKLGQTVDAQVKLRLTSASIDKMQKGQMHRESFDVLAISPGHMSGESSLDELMEKHEDGGRPNLQGIIGEELDRAEKKNTGKKKKSA